MAETEPPRYVGNPKHKRGRNRGRRGSYCPGDIDDARAQALLDASIAVGRASKRYSTDGRRAFCAQCHDATRNEWHGYPVSWHEVPPAVRAQWVHDGLVDSKAMRASPEMS
jgi:hypothetical protein